MYCLHFICERKFYARKNYATLEINPKQYMFAYNNWLFLVATWYNVILKSYNVFLNDLVLKTNDGASYLEVRPWKDFFSLSGFLFLNCYDFYPIFLKMATLHQVGGTQLETTQGLCNYIHVF